MFQFNGCEYELLADAAQEAEYLHMETGRQQDVRATQDCPYGLFQKDEIVYTSKGPVD